MFKWLFKIAILMLVVGFGASFLAGLDGDTTLEWLGWRVQLRTSLLVVILIIMVVIIVAFDRILGFLALIPSRITAKHRLKAEAEGQEAITLGLVAVAIGDRTQAHRHAKIARKRLPDSRLSALLAAELASLEGDTEAAAKFFTHLTDNKATAWLGHAGIMRLNAESGNDTLALEAGRAAFAIKKNTPHLAKALFVLEAKAENWAAAITALKIVQKNAKDKASTAEHNRAMAVLQYQLATTLEGADKKLPLLVAAAENDPTLIPAVLEAGATLKDQGKTRKAIRLTEQSYRACPHSATAAALMGYWSGNRAANLARLIRLSDEAGNPPESLRICASTAFDIGLWGEAQRLAESVPPNHRNALHWALLAQIASHSQSDGLNREDCLNHAALAPRPPTWLCRNCHTPSENWHAQCPECGGFASIEWRSATTVPKIEKEP